MKVFLVGNNQLCYVHFRLHQSHFVVSLNLMYLEKKLNSELEIVFRIKKSGSLDRVIIVMMSEQI